MTTNDTSRTRAPRAAVRGSYVVALVLSIGVCTALNLLTFGVLYDAVFSSTSGISENATQILTGWGGGILGVIGAVVGYQAGAQDRAASEPKSTIGVDSTYGEK